MEKVAEHKTGSNIIEELGKIKQTPFVLIIGRPRSGTTLLRTMLDAHPNIKIPLESPFIKNFYPVYGSKISWTKEELTVFYNKLVKQPQFNLWTVDNESLKRKLLNAEGKTTFGELCKIIYAENISFYDKEEIKILADKNPPYTLYIPTLLETFPEARFIYITRDYRDNILSMLNVDFERPWIASLAYRWKYYNKKFLKAQKKNPDRFFVIKYEDLVTNPEKHLTDICIFLNISYSPKMLNFQSKEKEILDIYPKELIEHYHKSLFEPISPKKVDQWKIKMRDSDIRKSDLIVGKYAEKMGYTRKYTKSNPFLYFTCLPGIFYGRLYYIIFNTANFLLPEKIREFFFRLLTKIFQPWWKKNYKITIDISSMKKNS